MPGITTPNKKLFSDPRLVRSFNKNVIKKIIEFSNIQDSFLKELKEMRYDSEYGLLKRKNAQVIIDNLESRVKFDNIEANKKPFIKNLQDITDRHNKCEICREKRNNPAKAHIITRAAFRNDQLKPKKAYSQYINSLANIMLVCENCHADLDKGRLANHKIRAIIRIRKKVNRRLIKTISRDIIYMKSMIKELKQYESQVKSIFRKRMSRILKFKSSLKKKQIRDIMFYE
ncbi:MAG: hypothetical protein WC916_01735 [Candidatus Woesearchaeota archaeon]